MFQERLGKALCRCGMHAWSAVEPGSLHLTNGEYAIIGVLWAQVGTRRCARPGCTVSQQLVRQGEFGYDGLNIGNRQVKSLDTTTGWGRSFLKPTEVLALEPYKHPVAIERLGVPATS